MLSYADTFLAQVPWPHWVVMGVLSLAMTLIILADKKYSVYGAICFGLSVFLGFFLLDIAVLIRWGDGVKHMTGFSLPAEYNRLIHGGAIRWTEMLANVAVFFPFGFFLSEFLFTTETFITPRHRLVRVTLVSFGLSLLIETLQLIFRLGVFEVTDLILNTFGGFVGTGLSSIGRLALTRLRGR